MDAGYSVKSSNDGRCYWVETFYRLENKQNYDRYLKFAKVIEGHVIAEKKGLDRSETCSILAKLSLMGFFSTILTAGACFYYGYAYLALPGAFGALLIGVKIADTQFKAIALAERIKIIAYYCFANAQMKEAGELKQVVGKVLYDVERQGFVLYPDDKTKINAIGQDPAQFLTAEEQVQVHHALNTAKGGCSQTVEAQNCPCKPSCQPLT